MICYELISLFILSFFLHVITSSTKYTLGVSEGCSKVGKSWSFGCRAIRYIIMWIATLCMGNVPLFIGAAQYITLHRIIIMTSNPINAIAEHVKGIVVLSSRRCGAHVSWSHCSLLRDITLITFTTKLLSINFTKIIIPPPCLDTSTTSLLRVLSIKITSSQYCLCIPKLEASIIFVYQAWS